MTNTRDFEIDRDRKWLKLTSRYESRDGHCSAWRNRLYGTEGPRISDSIDRSTKSVSLHFAWPLTIRLT